MFTNRRGFLITFVSFLLLSLLFLPLSVSAQTTPRFLIINQVRGDECCGAGGVGELKHQIDVAIETGLPSYFALRYDALRSSEYVTVVQQLHRQYPHIVKPALLIEVTPNLAKQSEVTYHGDEEQWYRASQVFTLGYTPSDRQRLLDTAMIAYHRQFGEYPALTVGWMLDSDSLQYLQEKYHVVVHQITREQWGVDSYSLYGGPAHHPYPASAEWAFMPDFASSSSAMIIRQTVTDPLWNYGDQTSAFTSQPNDYARDGKSLEYFKALIAQAWNAENQPGFIVLGLENSMPSDIQAEYEKQLEWLAAFAQEKGATALTDQELADLYGTPQVLVYSGSDLTPAHRPAKAWWITTPHYRVRLLQEENTLWMTDLRVYDASLKDVYSQREARHQGYWIAPALIDVSLYQPPVGSKWWQWWKPPEVNLGSLVPHSDVGAGDARVHVATLASSEFLEMEQVGGQRQLSYVSSDGVSEKLRFDLETFIWESSGKWLSDIERHIATKVPTTGTVSVVLRREANQLSITPQIVATEWPAYQMTQPNRYFPEVSLVESPDIQHTIVYPNNRYTIVGQTPVRVVFAPKDQSGLPVGLTRNAEVTLSSPTAVVSPTSQTAFEEPLQFIDVSQAQPGRVMMTLTAQEFVWQTPLYFAPNCRVDWQYCVRHPRQGWWFVLAKVNDWIREKSE